MRHFSSLGAVALHLVEVELALHETLHHGLDKIAALIEKTAKAEIGVYQDALGSFPAWPELADSTKEDRLRQGFSENDPLLRTGQLQADITRETHGLEAVIGTPQSAPTAEIMGWMEFGTSKMPARPVIGPAAFRNRKAIEILVGAAVVAGFVGGHQIHEALGYDFTTKD